MRDFLPAPASGATDGGAPPIKGFNDTSEGRFYSCLAGVAGTQVSCDAGTIDAQKWDAGKFTTALSSRIIQPARHADSLIANWPYLTRLFTTISPAEMTEDPEFLEHDGLPDVRISGSGVRRVTCTGPSGMTLPDGRQVALTPTSTWPGFSNQMPFAERIEEYPSVGAGIVLVDNTERINAQLKLWNDSQGWPPPVASMPSSNPAGGTGGANFPQGQGGVNGSNAIAGGGGGDGCSCKIGSPASRAEGALPLAALLGLMGARRRKRR